MRLFKTHSHTSNGLAMEPGKREQKQLKGTQTLQKGRPLIKNLLRTAGVAGAAEKALYLRQTNHRKYSMTLGKPSSTHSRTTVLFLSAASDVSALLL